MHELIKKLLGWAGKNLISWVLMLMFSVSAWLVNPVIEHGTNYIKTHVKNEKIRASSIKIYQASVKVLAEIIQEQKATVEKMLEDDTATSEEKKAFFNKLKADFKAKVKTELGPEVIKELTSLYGELEPVIESKINEWIANLFKKKQPTT